MLGTTARVCVEHNTALDKRGLSVSIWWVCPRNRTVPLVTGVVEEWLIRTSLLAYDTTLIICRTLRRSDEPILYFFIIYYNTICAQSQVLEKEKYAKEKEFIVKRKRKVSKRKREGFFVLLCCLSSLSVSFLLITFLFFSVLHCVFHCYTFKYTFSRISRIFLCCWWIFVTFL